jgi:hypothetical protein
MPKDPVLSREIFYDTLRDGTLLFLDWALVNTGLGAMLEARSIATVDGIVTQWDPYDAGPTKISPLSEDQLFNLLNSGGRLWPRTFNTQ